MLRSIGLAVTLGVVVLSARFLGSWIRVERLRRRHKV